MPGCYVTRRDLLRWTAYAAAAAPAGALLVPGRAGGAPSTPVSATGLELVTLTEESAIITWSTGATGSKDDLGRLEPTAAEAEVRWGTSPDRLDQVASSGRTDTPYHRVELKGLEPGRTYWYEARSGDAVAAPTPFSMIEGNAVSTADGPPPASGPFSFTVPQPPPGRFLFSVVLCNDFHFGETVAGRSGDIPALAGVSQVPGHRPYPEVMFESLVEDASALGASFLLAAGDITAEAEPVDLATARKLLERFGSQDADWFLTRGNHDREHDGEAWASCSIGAYGSHDCFVDEFFPSGDPTYFADQIQGLRIIGIDTYDQPGKGSEPGRLSADQMDWFQSTVAEAPDQPTVVFGHHPLVVEASPYPSPPSSALETTQAAAITAAYQANPGVFLHHAGHTHRNHRSSLAAAPGVLHQEVAAVKEYPGGFTLLRVHEGGYALNFHKSSSDEARAWSERSRTQIGGTWPQFALGARVADRNAVVERDLSDLKAMPAATATAAAKPGGSSASGSSGSNDAEDGPNLLVRGVPAAVLVAAGAGGVLALRRRRDRGAGASSADAEPPAGDADSAST